MTGARGLFVLAALLGAAGVVIAALGAHAGPAIGDPAALRAWQSALLVHFAHVPALMIIALAADRFGGRTWLLAGGLMALGLVLFSGSLYRAEFLDLEGAGPTAPLGGASLILAWLLASVAAWRSRP